MTKRFRPWDPKQTWLLPPEITEFIPEGHPAHFVRDLVVDELNQRNFTDPESRIMPTKSGFEQCYNAQAGVDAKAQVIVACEVVNTSADCPQLLAMVD
jgi:hypothetical protein